jgi:hypothetical protein
MYKKGVKERRGERRDVRGRGGNACREGEGCQNTPPS